MTQVAVTEQPAGTLALSGTQTAWTDVQRAALGHLGIEDAPEADQQVFMHVAQRVQLDPFAKQLYMIGRKERGRNGAPDTTKWTIQTGIDGFRLIAERHPQYAGTLDPEWCGQDGVWREAWVERTPPVMARVKVLRHDRAHPISLPVRFNEFAATFSDGNLQGQWKSKPAHMIAKVAEAAALRKAFPQQLSGLYTDDEMAAEHRGSGAAGPAAARPAAGVTSDELTGQAPPSASTAQGEGRAAPAVGSHAAPSSDDDDVVDAELVDDDPAPAEPAPPADDEPKASTAQNRKMHALFREAEVTDRADRLYVTGLLLDRDLDTSKGLTSGDAQSVIDALQRLKEGGHPEGLVGAVNDLMNAAEQRRLEAEENGAVAEADAAAEAEDQAVADEAAAEQS